MIELHAHSTASDGRLHPAELVRLAAGRGVTKLALTDHDTTAGYQEAREAGEQAGVEILGAIEASAQVSAEHVHILGLGIDPAHCEIRSLIEDAREARLARARAILERLQKQGIKLGWPTLMAKAGGLVTRPHIAEALVEAGHVVDFREAFNRFLAAGATAHVPLDSPSSRSWIQAIQAAGGVAILAHPGHWTSHRVVRALIEEGLNGFEAVHPSHDASLQVYYQELADRHGLVVSGGSDFHGRYPEESDRLGTFSPSAGRLERLVERIGVASA